MVILLKYDAMVIRNKKRSVEKETIAINEIKEMIANGEEVLVCRLVEKTGLSRAFFYTNERVCEELKAARKAQFGKEFVKPQKVIIEKSLLKEIEILKGKLSEKDLIISNLEKELARLKKSKQNTDLMFIKKL